MLKGGRLLDMERIVVVMSEGTVGKTVTSSMCFVFSVDNSSSVISALGDSIVGIRVLKTPAVAVVSADDAAVVEVLPVAVTFVAAA